MGNCCPKSDDEGGYVLGSGNSPKSPIAQSGGRPYYQNERVGGRGEVVTDDPQSRREKALEAAEKRRAQDTKKTELSQELRYQQQRKERIEKAEQEAMRAGGSGSPPALRWQAS